MDNVTHALAGALLAAATVTLVERRGVTVSSSFRAAASVVGIIAAELPDSDLLYANGSLGMGKLGYMLHHRGHTHTVMFAILGALLIWVATLALRKELRAAPYKNALLSLALVGTISHLALDFTNNYGIHPFWPVVNSWYYGDAVFILEPWLWIVAIPPLFLYYRGRLPRSLLAFLVLAIMLAAWTLDFVAGGDAVALTAVLCSWIFVARRIEQRHRLALGMVAWVAVELIFFVSSSRAREMVREVVGANSYLDVALTPLTATPLCFSAIVVERSDSTYRITDATIAPYSLLRSANNCGGGIGRSGVGAVPSFRRIENTSSATSTENIRWGNEWTAPVAELRNLVATNCEAAAAMQFIRVPKWENAGSGAVELGDARFGVGRTGFASVTVAANPVSCPQFLPGWVSPRADLLR